MNERRRATISTLRELDTELEYRRAELAALERARDILARSDEHDRCDAYHAEAQCVGEVYSRFCRVCGLVLKRCDHHGGIRSAGYALDAHRSEVHGGQHAHGAETDDAGRLRTGSATVSMGRVPASPGRRGGGDPS